MFEGSVPADLGMTNLDQLLADALDDPTVLPDLVTLVLARAGLLLARRLLTRKVYQQTTLEIAAGKVTGGPTLVLSLTV